MGREQLMGRNRGEESCRGGIVWPPHFYYRVRGKKLDTLLFQLQTDIFLEP